MAKVTLSSRHDQVAGHMVFIAPEKKMVLRRITIIWHATKQKYQKIAKLRHIAIYRQQRRFKTIWKCCRKYTIIRCN